MYCSPQIYGYTCGPLLDRLMKVRLPRASHWHGNVRDPLLYVALRMHVRFTCPSAWIHLKEQSHALVVYSGGEACQHPVSCGSVARMRLALVNYWRFSSW